VVNISILADIFENIFTSSGSIHQVASLCQI